MSTGQRQAMFRIPPHDLQAGAQEILARILHSGVIRITFLPSLRLIRRQIRHFPLTIDAKISVTVQISKHISIASPQTNVRFQDLTAVTVKAAVLRNVTLCSLVEKYRSFIISHWIIMVHGVRMSLQNIGTFLPDHTKSHARRQQHSFFYIHGSVYRNSILIRSNKMQHYAGIYLLQNYSTCFGCPSNTSAGVHKTVTAASGAGHSIRATTFLQRGRCSDTMNCTRSCSYSFMYSCWCVRWTPETCRIILQ